MKRHLIKGTLLFLVVLLLSACNSTEKLQHIEVFVIETSEQNAGGFFEETGFKKVNAITTVEEGKNHLATDVKAIEDFYDVDGTYIKTVIVHSEFTKSKVTNVEDGDERKKELQEPSTILLPDESTNHFQLEDLTEEQEEQVRNHILTLLDKL